MGSGDAASSKKDGKVSGILKFINNSPDTALNFFAPGKPPHFIYSIRVLKCFIGSDEYQSDIYHWATSSSQNSLVTVQPDTAQDVAELVRSFSINKRRKKFIYP